MCKQSSASLLTSWATVEGLSQVARGLPRVANNSSVTRRYSICYSTIFRKLKAMVPSVRESNRRLLQSEICIDSGFDNFQLFLNKKLQRDGTSATSIHATCRLAKRSIPLIPGVGSLLSNNGIEYDVTAILQYSTYCSLLRVKLNGVFTGTRLLAWPQMGWTIVTIHGAEQQSKSIDYRNCHVPRSLYMRRHTGININYMMFHTMPHPLVNTNHNNTSHNNMSPCSASDYMMVLRRSRISQLLHTVFGYKSVKQRDKEKKAKYQDDSMKLEEHVVNL